tara:strand:- start:99 stop:995 length:897 start_codon:yes stop_codon:yes gene_type:complete
MLKHYNYHTEYPTCPFIYDFKNPNKKIDIDYEEIEKNDAKDRINILLDNNVSKIPKKTIENYMKLRMKNRNVKYFVANQNVKKGNKFHYINFLTTIYSVIYPEKDELDENIKKNIEYTFIPITFDDNAPIIKHFESDNFKNNLIYNNEDDDTDGKKDIIKKYEKETIGVNVNRRNKVVIPNKYRSSSSSLRSSLLSESKKMRLKENPHLYDIRKKANLSLKNVSDKIEVKKEEFVNKNLFEMRKETIENRNNNGVYHFYPPTSGRILIDKLEEELIFLSLVCFDNMIVITMHKINFIN